MQKFIVEGGYPLKGRISVSGSKNAAIKMVAASLLTGGEVVLENVPRIDDVGVMVDIAVNLGVKTQLLDEHTISLRGDEIFSCEVPRSLGVKSRSGIMTIGPLLARFGEVSVPEPGGCRIGLRPIDRHLKAFEALGAAVSYVPGFYKITSPRLSGGLIRFPKNTVMGTENILLAASLASGKTEILNAAEEPEVDDLIDLLVKMGAKIERSKDNPRKIVIEGVKELSGARHKILPDRAEAVTFAVAAAAVGGDVTLTEVDTTDLTAFLAKLERVGADFASLGSSLRVWREKDKTLSPVDVETGPYPAFATDWQQPFCVLLGKADGISRVHETVYEDRFGFVSELEKMGLGFEILTPSAAGIAFESSNYNFDWKGEGEPKTVLKINGPIDCSGANLSVGDLRAGATLVIAALCATGVSEIFGVEHIDRGYENFDGKLRSLGAKIDRVEV